MRTIAAWLLALGLLLRPAPASAEEYTLPNPWLAAPATAVTTPVPARPPKPWEVFAVSTAVPLGLTLLGWNQYAMGQAPGVPAAFIMGATPVFAGLGQHGAGSTTRGLEVALAGFLIEGALAYAYVHGDAFRYSCPLVPGSGCAADLARIDREALVPMLVVPLAFSLWSGWDAYQRAAASP